MATAVEQRIMQEAQSFEAYAARALTVIGARANAWLSLQKTAAAYGITPTQVLGPELVERHRVADELAARVGRAIKGLEAGTSEIVPVRIGDKGAEFLAVRTIDGSLGFWPIVLRVLQVASMAALAGGGWQLSNAWLDVKKAEADALALRADTSHKLAELAQQVPDANMRQALALAAAEANKAADAGGTSWIDKFTQALGQGAAVAGGAGALWLIGLFLLSRRGSGGRRRAAA